MHPAFSVIFLTTLIGVGQGFFLALYTGQVYSSVELLPAQDHRLFYALGSAISLVFLVLGLLSSFFHLGHPERAWRAATRWRTSWLSREVIALPGFMFFVFLYGLVHYFGWEIKVLGHLVPFEGQLGFVVGGIGVVLCFSLFVCTGMIYACLKFLQEWHHPLTVINYLLLGSASGFTLATAFAVFTAPGLVQFYGVWAMIITGAALITRGWSLIRNARIKPKSTAQTAIGVRHQKIVQKAQGFMGGSFNTREFFHGAKPVFFKSIKWIFLVTVFPVPMALLAAGLGAPAAAALFAAFLVQYAGLLAERWFFFAQANHPQNLYYQTI